MKNVTPISNYVRYSAEGSNWDLTQWPLIYLAHIVHHFLSAVLSHRKWLNQRAGCT